MRLVSGALMALLGPKADWEEQTTTANVGAFPVPLGKGEPLKRVFPSNRRKRKRKKKRQEHIEDRVLLARACALLEQLTAQLM